jgi:hypothetical protein
MIIRAGVTERNSKVVPRTRKMMLPLASKRSLHAAPPTRGRTKDATAGNTTVNSAIYTAARRERSKPAYMAHAVRSDDYDGRRVSSHL